MNRLLIARELSPISLWQSCNTSHLNDTIDLLLMLWALDLHKILKNKNGVQLCTLTSPIYNNRAMFNEDPLQRYLNKYTKLEYVHVDWKQTLIYKPNGIDPL